MQKLFIITIVYIIWGSASLPNIYRIDPNFVKRMNNLWNTIKPFEVTLVGPEYGGRASKIPWSGYWWPFLDSTYTDNMYDANGPLDKYDQYAKKVSGQTSNAVQLEKSGTSYPMGPHYTTNPSESWFGHCNGLAAAGVLEPEPKSPKTKQGITFTVGDQKGLMTEAHWYDNVDLWQPVSGTTLEAHVFHKTLIDWIGKGKEAVIMDVSFGPVKNNHPISVYKMQYVTDANDPSKTHVTCMVWGSNYAPKDFVGTEKKPCESWPNPYGKTYYYWISGSISNPTNGGWEKGCETDHSDFIWHPLYFPSNYIVKDQWVKDILS